MVLSLVVLQTDGIGVGQQSTTPARSTRFNDIIEMASQVIPLCSRSSGTVVAYRSQRCILV